MKPEDMDRLIRTALREVAPDADLAQLGADADLREALGLDSLDFLRVVELLSQRTGHRIDEEDYPRLATITSATTFLSDRAAVR